MTDLARRSLAEAIATFLLVFIDVRAIAAEGAGGDIGPLGIALAFGFVVAAMVYSVGRLRRPATHIQDRGGGRAEPDHPFFPGGRQ